MLYVQKYLQTHTLEELKDEFDIKYKLYDDRVILKYGIMSKPKFHPIVKECRGLILSLPDYKVISRGFDRFFNYGEGDDKDDFDWDNCLVFNKLDGSLCKVYHDGVKWCVSTSGTAFAEGETPMGKTYHDLFVEAIGGDLDDRFNLHRKHFTYIFELTSPENRIVTRYHETKATLLGVRNNTTGDYLDYSILKTELKHMSYTELVESYDINNVDDVLKFVEGRDAMDEGVVLYDMGTQMRIKLKSSGYVAIHHLRGNEVTKKSIVTLLLKGEMDEYIAYFPEDGEMVQPYIDRFEELKDDITNTYNEFKDIEDQKEFAMNVKDLEYSGFLFAMRKGMKLKDLLTVDRVNHVVKFFEEV